MNPIALRQLGAAPLASLLAFILQAAPAVGAETAALSSPGVIDFAGRAARNHWYLFSEGRRAELEELNRELREAQRQQQRAKADAERRTATERGDGAAQRLLAIVQASPRLIRVDLTAAKPALVPGGPFAMPGDTGAFLFEVVAGGSGLRFSTALLDLTQPLPGESGNAVADVAPTGTTYVVVGFEHVPTGRNTLQVEFRQPRQAPRRFPIDFVMPAAGRLKLTVLSDDTGQPTPAMVRLVWQTDGLARRPANGIEFAAQFEQQGRTTGERSANLPGPQADPFWCVPGPFDMMLPPGHWTIGVRRGVEHEVIFEEVTIRAGETLERTYRPRRWVDLRRLGWWSGDDHVHCRIVSDDDARRLMAWVQAEDVHLANIVKMGDIYRTYFEQRGFGPAFRVIDGEYVLAPGQECPRTHEQIGHTLAMNITSLIRNPDRYFLYDEIFDAVHAQGGLTGYAHVNSDLFFVHRDMTLNVPRQKVDFAEILQFNKLGTELYYEFLNLGCKLTASSGSDVPWGGTIGEARVYAWLGQTPFSADAWFAAFRLGRTFTTSGPMLELQVDDALPGDEIRLQSDRPLRVRARAWGDPKRMAPVKLELVRHGEVVRAAESADPIRPEAVLEVRVDAGYGCWIAARAAAGDGTSAHTTPVYVVREGFRFWKYDGLDALLDKRLASLAEIEQLVAEAQRLDAGGQLESDRYRRQLARQGDALLERVALVRELYAGLKRTAEAERGLREGRRRP
jgi:hypothetical protein